MVKKVMDNIYAHKSNLRELLDNVPENINTEDRARIRRVIDNVADAVDYEVIKYSKSKRTVSLIESPNWNEANEPWVGDSYTYNIDTGLCKVTYKRKKNPQIYHSKWMFVADDYKGFDVTAAKKRTEEWNKIPNLDKKRIGNRDYWIQLLKANGMEV